MACLLVESSIRTRKLHTVTYPQNHIPDCQRATVFLDVYFPLPRLGPNYQVLLRFYHVYLFNLNPSSKLLESRNLKKAMRQNTLLPQWICWLSSVPLQRHPLMKGVPPAHSATPQQVPLHPELSQQAISLVPTAKRQSRTIPGTDTIHPDQISRQKCRKEAGSNGFVLTTGRSAPRGFALRVRGLTVTSAGRKSAKRERRTRENGWRGGQRRAREGA